MNSDDFKNAAVEVLGTTVGWQSEIAKNAGRQVDAVRRWMLLDEAPEWVEKRLAILSAQAKEKPWVAHLFVAQVGKLD